MKKRNLMLSIFVFSCLLLSLCSAKSSHAETYVLDDSEDLSVNYNVLVEDKNYSFQVHSGKEGRYAVFNYARVSGNELIVPDAVEYKGRTHPVTHFVPNCSDESDSDTTMPYQTVTLPDCVQYVSITGLWPEWPNLTKINIPKSMKELSVRNIEQKIQYIVPDEMEHYDFKNNALYSKKNPGKLVYVLNIPEKYSIAEGTTILGQSCFFQTGAHRDVKEITVPASLEEIESSAFSQCFALKKVNMSKSKVKVLSKNVFTNTSKLKQLSLPKTVESIEKKAFVCSGISSLSIPPKVSTVGVEAFGVCKKLKSITLEGTKKMPTFAEKSFKNARSGIKFYVKNKKMAKQLKKNLKGSKIKKAKIYAGKKKKLVYKNVNS